VATPLNETERRALRKKARRAILDALRALGGEARREAIREWALAHGGFSPRELAAPPPEAAAEKYRCSVDHQLSWALTNLKREGLLEKPKWSAWRLSNAALAKTETVETAPVAAERLAQLRAMPYEEYLRTPEWRRTRAAALWCAGYSCSLDVTHTDGLEVHHRTYEHLGAELIADLIVLCHSCHRLHHREYGRPRREPSTSPPRLRAPLENLASTSTTRPGKRRKRSLLRRLLAN
jgi:hypothetical protein